jgi:hypothetical protein
MEFLHEEITSQCHRTVIQGAALYYMMAQIGLPTCVLTSSTRSVCAQ